MEVTKSCNALSKLDPKHPPILISLPLHAPCFLKPVTSPRHNFFKSDYNGISQYLRRIDWMRKLDGCHSVNNMTDIFYNTLKEAIDLYVPKLKPKISKYPPWFSRSLVKIISEKNCKRQKYLKYKNPRDLLEYELLRERVHKVSKQCLFNYKIRVESGIFKNPKSFWHFIKERRNGASTIPAEMFQGDQTASTGPQIADMFANSFSSVFSKAVLSNDDADIKFNESTYSVSHIKITECDIIRGIKKLDVSKGAGPDEIPPIFIKRCGSAITLPLSIIYNRSLCDGVFPDMWKVAKIVPVFKKGTANDVGNYRPISILSCIPKLFESLVCPAITRHMNTFISEHQHGFRKGHSVETNLLSYTSYLCENVDRGQEIDALYMDFSSAFDKVCHSRLINKLRRYGVSGSLLEWFRSYLAKRLQYVVINGHRSKDYMAISGVPQGSHLGPVLFSAFINDIALDIRNCKFSLFADDLKIYKTIKCALDIELVQEDLNRISIWCNLNGMVINTKKSYHIRFSRKRSTVPTTYKLNAETLQEVHEIRDLGVIIDSKLKFKAHIDAIVAKSAKMLGFLKRNAKGFLSNRTKVILFNSLVRSQLEFASIIWNPNYATYSQRIENIQRSFTRHLAFHSSGIFHRAPYDLRLKHFNLMSLKNRRTLLNIIFLKKLISGDIDCNHLLQSVSLKIPYHYPRHPITEIFYIPLSRTNLLKYSPLPRVCLHYNEICKKVADIDIFHDTYPKFKEKLCSYFLKCNL